MNLYVYCICADLDTFDKPVTGVNGGEVRVLKIEGFSLLVSDCEEATANPQNALAHAAVVKSVLEQTTPLPFRFGTATTEQQLRSFISTNKIAIASKLEHLRGCVEMDLKMVWHGKPSSPPAIAEEPVGPGTAFLRAKRREIAGDERVTRLTKEISGHLAKELSDVIKDEKMSLAPSEMGVQGKVFHLVEISRIQHYRERVSELPQKQPEFELQVSGPWPPYSFADIELEFDSHFGVS